MTNSKQFDLSDNICQPSESALLKACMRDQRFKKLIVDFEGLLDRFLVELKNELGDDEILEIFLRRFKVHDLIVEKEKEKTMTTALKNAMLPSMGCQYYS